MLLRIAFFILALVVYAAPAYCAKEIYVWRDSQGILHMQNTKPEHLEEHETRMEQRQRFMDQNPDAAEQNFMLEQERKSQAPGGGTYADQESQPKDIPQLPPQEPSPLEPEDPSPSQLLKEMLRGIFSGLTESPSDAAQEQGTAFEPTPKMILLGLLPPLLLAFFIYVCITYILYRLGQKFGVGSFGEFLIPLYNVYLLCRCAGLAGPYMVLLLIPFIQIAATFILWGKIAGRLGKNPFIWGAICTLFFIPIIFLALDDSRPWDYKPSPPKPQAPNW